jgi:hypothetical protein
MPSKPPLWPYLLEHSVTAVSGQLEAAGWRNTQEPGSREQLLRLGPVGARTVNRSIFLLLEARLADRAVYPSTRRVKTREQISPSQGRCFPAQQWPQ